MLLDRIRLLSLAALFLLALFPSRARALERICDPAFEDCRAPIIQLIRAETVGIDVGFWFMEDTRYATELINKSRAGVPVRVIADTRAVTQYGYNQAAVPLQMMRDGGVPMRTKTGSGIFHFKMILFAGQNTVQFSGANYSPNAFVPNSPYVDYVDEIIYFTDHSPYVNSFKTRFDDVWTSTSGFVNYANVTSLARHYPTFAIDPELNFVPWQNFRSRSVALYKTETQGIDSIMYRITDRAHSDQMIAAEGRGVRVRIISEPLEYRNANRLWVAWNLDRMHAAGVEVRMRQHQGINHEKLTLLNGQGMTIMGSSNWTSASASSQHEHNLFTTQTAMYNWSRAHFDRKWNNTGPAVETAAFVPLPPNTPLMNAPANGAQDQATSVTLRWYAGPWAHKYDVYMGTSTSSMTRILDDRELGPSEWSTDYITWSVSNLAPGTTYYWYVVSRTMANVSRTGPTWSFTTAGGTTPPPPPPPSGLPTGWSTQDVGAVGAAGSAGFSSGTYTVRGSGADVWGTADEFRFAYTSMSGDGSIVARVATVQNVNVWTKAGVMIRESTAAGARHAFMLVSPGKGLAFQRRATTGGTSTHTAGPAGTAPYWVRLQRSGTTITASVSTNGSTWTTVGTQTISFPSTVQVGLAVSSHVDGTLATATFDNVTVGGSSTPPPPPPASGLPTGWSSGDIGSVGTAGTASFSSGTFSVSGSGPDIWGTADEFRFAYRTMTGDGSITARVASLTGPSAWSKAGVMIRETLGSGAKHAAMVVSPGNGLAVFSRSATGGSTTYTNSGAGAAPYWVRLTRSGTTITAAISTNGSTWTTVGTQTISMTATVYIGLAVSSGTSTGLATATFTNVSPL